MQNRILGAQSGKLFTCRCAPSAKEFLLREGTDLKYGARHLKRAIERHLVVPLSNLMATDQVTFSDSVRVDLGSGRDQLIVVKEHATLGFAPATGSPAALPTPSASRAVTVGVSRRSGAG